MNPQVISSFAEFEKLDVAVQVAFYKLVSLQIIVGGLSLEPAQLTEEKMATFENATIKFVKDLDKYPVTMTLAFLNQYRVHVANTMVSNLSAMDIFLSTIPE